MFQLTSFQIEVSVHNLKKILNQKQLQATDEHTIKTIPIASIDLMEQAALEFINNLDLKALQAANIAFFCGSGNNGGDGFAIARRLIDLGYSPTTFLVPTGARLSPDCQTNFERLADVNIIKSEADIPSIDQFDIVIDALFGSGLSRPVEGIASACIHAINQSKATVIAIDIPSGMYCDKIMDGIAVQANKTITFQRPKLSFFFEEHFDFVGELTTINIGLDEAFIQRQNSPFFILDNEITHRIKPRLKASHKGTYGHALMVVGSIGSMGAGILSAKASMRSGAGLVTTHIPGCGYEIMQTALPEAMCSIDAHNEHITGIPNLDKFDAIGIGPGLGTHVDTQNALKNLVQANSLPLILDADAINILSMNRELLAELPENSILTPHQKEFERLVGKCQDSLDRIQKQITLSKTHKIIVILKGAHTQICDANGNVYFNTSGNPGMATGGSGDVLTGIITGLLAQDYSPLDAALLGVYFHGVAGDQASIKHGQASMIASDLIEELRF